MEQKVYSYSDGTKTISPNFQLMPLIFCTNFGQNNCFLFHRLNTYNTGPMRYIREEN